MNWVPAKWPTIALSAGYGSDSLRGGKNDCLQVGAFGNNPLIGDFGIKAYKGKMKAHGAHCEWMLLQSARGQSLTDGSIDFDRFSDLIGLTEERARSRPDIYTRQYAG